MKSEGSGPLRSLARQLRHARPVRTFDGSGTKFRVDVVWITDDGRPLVLDTSSRVVRALRDDNTVIDVVSVRATEPMSSPPTRLDGDAQGRVLVAGGDDLAIFTPSQVGYIRDKTISSEAPIEDICSVGGEIYVRSSGKAGVLSRYSMSGQPLGAFGRGYDADDIEIARFMSKGRIACVGTPLVIVSAAAWLPIVHGYGADGQVKWIARFEDYMAARLVEEHHRGQTRMRHAQPDFADRLWRVVRLDPHHVIVQLRRFSPTASHGPHRLHTYVLDAATGEGAYVGDGLPELYASRGSLLYGAVRTAFHRLLVYTLEPETGPLGAAGEAPH